MRARYNGRCRNCGGRIYRGDEIRRCGNRWVHAIGACEGVRESYCPIQAAEQAAERAFEQRLYGCREYD